MTMITPSYLGETIEYSSLHACRSTLEDPTFVEIRILAFAHKQRAQPHGNCVQPVHQVHAQTSFSRITPEMAEEIRSQLAASRSRCRLPSRVSE